MKANFPLLLMLVLASVCSAQTRYISGKILDQERKTPVPYASIYNKTLQSGTLSDVQGRFRISIRDEQDSVYVSFMGYRRKPVQLKKGKTDYVIYLEESAQLLQEVRISALKDDWLYDFLNSCKTKTATPLPPAKAYYVLKSYRDTEQVELVEAFFNARLQGGEPERLDMKAGRFGLKAVGDRFFNSFETSGAILQFRLRDDNTLFPGNPLAYSVRKMRKKFNLVLEKKYLDFQGDSIYVVRFTPKESKGQLFSGVFWIHAGEKRINRFSFTCEGCLQSPFVPIFSTDSISDVRLSISREFKTRMGQEALYETDFSYSFHYFSRKGKSYAEDYVIKSNAVLYVYDYTSGFELPRFDFAENCVSDYLKINAMPYNEFFWDRHSEAKIYDFEDQNDRFYSEPGVITNRTWYKNNPYFKRVYESPFITWSDYRILIKDLIAAKGLIDSTHWKPETYKLSVKFFLDINHYQDSTHCISSTVFDPWETYYYYRVDTLTNCFLNLYFDIHEIQRQEFARDIQSCKDSPEIIRKKFEAMQEKASLLARRFLNETNRGLNYDPMIKWNDYVRSRLGIDNMLLFRQYREGDQGKK